MFNAPPRPNSHRRDVYQVTVHGKELKPLVRHGADDFVLDWTSDGQTLLFGSDRSGSLAIWAVESGDKKSAAEPRLIKELGAFTHLGLTRNGRYFYSPGRLGRRSDVYVATLDEETGKVIKPPEQSIYQFEGANSGPDWSPDGKQHICLSRRSGTGSVLVVRSLADNKTRLLVPELNDINTRSLHWSPDGRSMLVSGKGEGHAPGVYQIDTLTGQAVAIAQLAEMADAWLSYPKWSSDGRAIYYIGGKNNRRKKRREVLRRCDLQTGQDEVLYRRTGSAVLRAMAPSPDDERVAVVEGEKLVIVPVEGGEPRTVEGLRAFPCVAWTPDGQFLFAGRSDADPPNEKVTLVRVPIDGGEPLEIDISMGGLGHLRVHPDGRQITFDTKRSNSTREAEVWVLENFLP